jgi:hypothetical protein
MVTWVRGGGDVDDTLEVVAFRLVTLVALRSVSAAVGADGLEFGKVVCDVRFILQDIRQLSAHWTGNDSVIFEYMIMCQ